MIDEIKVKVSDLVQEELERSYEKEEMGSNYCSKHSSE